mmetsp:Transcript_17356/g.39279  ORF Transcript_17356/g.39279 Transcript_17356/m.39279 type:complete len:255 (-) Transcript_17356:58-822(-)
MAPPNELELLVVAPSAVEKEGKAATKLISIGLCSEVAALRKQIVDTFSEGSVEDLVLYFQNQSGPFSHGLKVLSDECNLHENGVASKATVVCQTAHWEKLKSKGGDSVYYMWSANGPVIAEEHRVQSGGEPKKLGEEQRAAGEGALPIRKMQNYSWVDESRKLVKIYIYADGEPVAVAAAGSGEESQLQTEFGAQSLRISVLGASATYLLNIEELEHAVVPEECKVKVSPAKKITITLRKAKDDQLWHSLVKRK